MPVGRCKDHDEDDNDGNHSYGVYSIRSGGREVFRQNLRRQRIEQGLGLLKIARIEAFGEPAIDGSEKVAGFIPLSLAGPISFDQRAARASLLIGNRILR